MASIVQTALRDANAELAAYQVALDAANPEDVARARNALGRALDLYDQARALLRFAPTNEG